MVLRTGKQDELNPPPPPAYPSDALNQHPVDQKIPLDSVGISILFQKAPTPEQVGVELPSTEETLQVKKEDDLELLDRLLQPGVRTLAMSAPLARNVLPSATATATTDYEGPSLSLDRAADFRLAFQDIVKLSHLSPESGIVTAVDIQCGLLHALSKNKVSEPVSHKLLTGAIAVEVGDRYVPKRSLGRSFAHARRLLAIRVSFRAELQPLFTRVINSDWIGVIEQIFEEGLVETEEKIAWRIADMFVLSHAGQVMLPLRPANVVSPRVTFAGAA